MKDKSQLTETQYYVTQENGTEKPFENEFDSHFEKGIYVDIVSGEPLFSSEDKFQSGCGWPAFSKTLIKKNIAEKRDRTHGMERVEVRSVKADSHLGHVFNDGPAPTGQRYCINSAAMEFIPFSELESRGYSDLIDHFNKAGDKNEN